MSEREPVGEVAFDPDAEDVLIACNGTALFMAPTGTQMPEPDDTEWADGWVEVGWTTDDGLTWIDVDKGKPKV